MKNTNEIETGNYYLFESLSSAHSIYFKSEEEISIFKKLLLRYLSSYVDVHRIFIDRNGYQVLVRVKQRRTIRRNYIKYCEKAKKVINLEFISNPWKLISESMRIFKSIYVRSINRIRGREGVLVKHRYKRYLFESVKEYEGYIKMMESGARIRSQKLDEYMGGKLGLKGGFWSRFRARGWSEMVVFKGFASFVVLKLIKQTLTHHNTLKTTNSTFLKPKIVP